MAQPARWSADPSLLGECSLTDLKRPPAKVLIIYRDQIERAEHSFMIAQAPAQNVEDR